MRYLPFIFLLFFTACKTQIDINSIEQRQHDLSFIKGTNKLVSGEVVRKFENGRIAERSTYKDGKAIGNWYAYGYQGEVVSHGFGVDPKKYESTVSNTDLSYCLLSINIEGSLSFGTFYVDNKKLFDEPVSLLAIAKEVFKDYSEKYKIGDILFYDNDHEFTVYKTATISNSFKIDTANRKDKKVIFIK